MKITYTPNPLRTIVELDEGEKKLLWYRIKCDEMADMLFLVYCELEHKEAPNMDRIKDEVDPAYYLDEDPPEKSGLDKRCDNLLTHYIEELQGSHLGDCTCFAMSCPKCMAEGKLGIDTIKGLGKHPGHKIQSAFSYKEGDVWKERTLDEALAILKDYEPKPASGSGWEKVGGFEAHIPRWKAEAKVAYEWLKNYRDEHFPEQRRV